ncbi:restriction endonuclease subunit S [Pseudoalteromonas lipolytica]|uniref:Restriction endonuclease subunit S n=1 Tax=Pseudoalteromonas lipolytica TaxID=570156 RepID=A0AAD0S0M9_9GAMM|nr:restriction endonuclease subunit S [Pseudoalteromonas donghaensis]AXV65943.1 restriction endonuclease subunit S [Pseudoalteromonas donghaensis]
MAGNFPFIKLKDICVKITKGSTPTKKDGGFSEQGINFIKAESATYDGVLDESKFTFVTEEVYEKYKRSQLEENDILFSMAGAFLGKTGLVEKKHLPANTNQALALIRVDSSLANPKFVHYSLQQGRIVHYVNNSISQSAQPNINLQQIGDLDIEFPAREIQDSIVDVLDSIVQRILVNRQTNRTLEQMAQALFKSWFVDFDPVIDNALAAGNNIPEALQHKAKQRKQAQKLPDFKPLPDDIRALFPSEFEQTDEPSIGIAGWIPKGWNFGSMKQHANIVMGQSPKGDTYNNEGLGTPLVNGPVEFGDYFTKKSKWTSAPTKLSLKGDLIVCVRGSTTGRFVKSDGVYCLGRGVCSVRGMRSQIFTDLIFKNSIEHLLGLATGSTFPNWSRQILNEFKVILPCTQIVDAFDKLLSENLKKIELNVVESKALNNLRDTLLPKLISGELSVENNC